MNAPALALLASMLLALPSEIPVDFKPTNHGFDHERREVMTRPLRGPQNPTSVDHATDTIDWLVKNVPESNGKVGILGISYDGFLPLMISGDIFRGR